MLGMRLHQSWLVDAYKFPLSGILFQSNQAGAGKSFVKAPNGEWIKIAQLPPVCRSTCVSFNDHLFSVGGMPIDVVCGDILCYEEEENEWRKIGELLMPRYNFLAEIIDDQLVVVGGWLNQFEQCDLMEITTHF